MSEIDVSSVEQLLKEKVSEKLEARSKANMPWAHYLIFAPFFFIVGIFKPSIKRSFWEDYLTVFMHVVYMPERFFRKIDSLTAAQIPRWWYTSLVHERCHMSQQEEHGRWTFYWRYCSSREWRVKYEVEAYMTDLFLYGLLGHAPIEFLAWLAERIAGEAYMMKPPKLHQDEWERRLNALLFDAQSFMRNDRDFEAEIDTHRRAIGSEELISASLLLYEKDRPKPDPTAHCRLPSTLINFIHYRVEEEFK